MVAPISRWGLALPLSPSLKPRECVRESWQEVLPPWVPWAEQESALNAPRAPRHSCILRRGGGWGPWCEAATGPAQAAAH